MFSFIGMSLAGMVGKQLGGRAAKALGIGVLVALLAIAAVIAVKVRDHRMIASHDAKQDAVNSKADRKADEHAAETRRVDDTRLAGEEAQLQKVREDNAKLPNATDRRLARQRCIRLQQAARAEGRESPACG